MIVVSDTSPILNLARVGRLALLQVLYNQVLIPAEVFRELTASKHDRILDIDLMAETWLVVATPKDQERVRELGQDLDAGEAEAIVLAIERGADLFLVQGDGFAGRSGSG